MVQIEYRFQWCLEHFYLVYFFQLEMDCQIILFVNLTYKRKSISFIHIWILFSKRCFFRSFIFPFFSAVCLPRNYSSMDIPLIDEPNKIAIEIHISDVLKINDRDFSITFSLYFNVRWIEPRLRLNPMFFQNRYV